MDREAVRAALMEAVKKLVQMSGMPAPNLDGVDILGNIPGFESTDWPYAMVDIADALGIIIPDNMNIFAEKVGKSRRKRRTSEIIDILMKCSKKEAN